MEHQRRRLYKDKIFEGIKLYIYIFIICLTDIFMIIFE